MKSERVKATIRSMPPLSHYPDRSVEFDIANSEVMQWVVSQAEVQKWLFESIKESGLIVFDPDSKLWRGADR